MSGRRQPPPPVVETNDPKPRTEVEQAPPMAEVTTLRRGADRPPYADAVRDAFDAAQGVDAAVAGPDGREVLRNLVAMRQVRKDPYADYNGDGTRKLRFIQNALAHEAQILNISRQVLETRILLGEHALSKELLDMHFEALYGEPRDG